MMETREWDQLLLTAADDNRKLLSMTGTFAYVTSRLLAALPEDLAQGWLETVQLAANDCRKPHGKQSSDIDP